MSKEIPLDRALSDDDRLYLRQRGSVGVSLERRIDENFPPDPEALAAYEVRERALYASQHSAGSELADVLARNADLERQLAELRAAQETPPPANAPVDYNDRRWTKAALEDEVTRVNAEDPEAKIAKGTKEEMAAALTAYFAE